MTSMTQITPGEVLRNEQHPLTRRLRKFITVNPTFGISLRPLTADLQTELIGKEASL